MKIAFLSPHNDDEALFGAFTIMREKPLVFIVTDSHIQTNRGEKGCDAETRWGESKNACDILGAAVVRVGVKDFELQKGALAQWFKQTIHGFDKIYAPAIQNGNPHHDMIGEAAKEAFGDKVVHYATYAPGQWFTKGDASKGDIELKPTPEERALKERALLCYVSQIALPATRPHFEAIKNQSEWLIK